MHAHTRTHTHTHTHTHTREWALFSLMPSALSFVFLWHTHTHTHTSAARWARIPEVQVRIPSRAMGTFFPYTVSSIFRLSLTHTHTRRGEWALFPLMPSALSFVFLWHTHTHTHTHTSVEGNGHFFPSCRQLYLSSFSDTYAHALQWLTWDCCQTHAPLLDTQVSRQQVHPRQR